MWTIRRIPCALAAATTFRGPPALTASKAASGPSRIATRFTIASQPAAAASSDAASVTSPRTASAASGRAGSEACTSTRSECPADASDATTSAPT